MGMSAPTTVRQTRSTNCFGEALPGFKKSEAGVIPQDWGVSTVGAEFTVQLGKMLDAAKNAGTPKLYIGNRSVQWGRVDVDDLVTVPMTPLDLQRFRLRRGDLLVCEGGEIGRAAIWADPIPECYYQKALHRLRARGSYNEYLMMSLLQLWTSTGHLGHYVTQTSIAHLPKDRLEVVPLPVPLPAEQHAIAEALSDVDGSVAALEGLIAKKRAIKQGAMQQLLIGKTRLPGFIGEWDSSTLKQVAEIDTGINKPISEMGSGTLYVTVQDLYDGTSITAGRLGRIEVSPAEIQAKTLEVGDIVFGKSSVKRDGIGYPSQFLGAGEPVVFSGFTYCARARDGIADGTFLFYSLRSSKTRRWVIEHSQSSALTNINQRIADAIPITLPPLREQSAIANVLSDMDAEISALGLRRDKTRSIKQGMMQQLLTGRVRLIKPAPAEARA
jgi:type I restriction enzyme S subunit